jgi:hypothetical protein
LEEVGLTDSFEEQYAEGALTACTNPDGFTVAAIGMLITDSGISWMDEQYVLADTHPKPPTHHLFGAVKREAGDLICEGHRFRIVTHGDETAGDWNLVLRKREILELHDDVEYELAKERARMTLFVEPDV